MSSSVLLCWSCSASLDGALGAATCPACGVVVPVHPKASPYALLGIEGTPFDVDTRALERAWLMRSRQVHPDRFATKSDVERRYAVEQTAALNAAYALLRDPLARASWLLRQRGAMNDVMPTQAFLIEMLEAREEAGASPAALARTVERARTQFDETLAAVARGFAGEGSLDELGRRVSELRYLARLVEELGGPRAPASVARH